MTYETMWQRFSSGHLKLLSDEDHTYTNFGGPFFLYVPRNYQAALGSSLLPFPHPRSSPPLSGEESWTRYLLLPPEDGRALRADGGGACLSDPGEPRAC